MYIILDQAGQEVPEEKDSYLSAWRRCWEKTETETCESWAVYDSSWRHMVTMCREGGKVTVHEED